MFRKKKKDPEIDLNKKFGSFAFFLSVPSALLIGLWLSGTFIAMFSVLGFDKVAWPLFAHAFIMSVYFFSGTGFPRTRTLLHELKHVALVVVTGNNVMDVKIGKGEGHVSYEVYKDTLHLEPFVILAPYFCPLLSFPALLAGVAAELFAAEKYRLIMVYVLGLALGIDLATAFREITPHQTDLKRIFGGYITTRAFIFVFHFMWLSICMLWVLGGWKGYLHALNIAGRLFSELSS